MAMSPWAIAGIVVGGVAVVGILYAVSNSGTPAIEPPRRGGGSGDGGTDGWGAENIGRGLNSILPSIFGGIRSLGSGSTKSLNDSNYRENPETRVNTADEKASAMAFDAAQDANPTVAR